MRRREFLGLVAGMAAGCPLVASAQQAMPVVGILGSGTAESQKLHLGAIRRGLADAGYSEGHNLTLEVRWADGQYDRTTAIAHEFVQRSVAGIVTLGGIRAAQAAKDASSSIPIIFLVGPDPISAGLVSSISRPTGNLTGITTLTDGLAAKRLELVREMVPSLKTVAVLVNPRNPAASIPIANETIRAAGALGIRTHVVNAGSDTELEDAFATMARLHAEAFLVGGDPFHLSRRSQIVRLAARYQIPAAYYSRDYVTAGGLVSYGSDTLDAYRHVGRYAGRILDGIKPAELPILHPTKFDLAINLAAAKALGLTVPPTLLARADEVIE